MQVFKSYYFPQEIILPWEDFPLGGLLYMALACTAVSFKLLQCNLPEGPKGHQLSLCLWHPEQLHFLALSLNKAKFSLLCCCVCVFASGVLLVSPLLCLLPRIFLMISYCLYCLMFLQSLNIGIKSFLWKSHSSSKTLTLIQELGLHPGKNKTKQNKKNSSGLIDLENIFGEYIPLQTGKRNLAVWQCLWGHGWWHYSLQASIEWMPQDKIRTAELGAVNHMKQNNQNPMLPTNL